MHKSSKGSHPSQRENHSSRLKNSPPRSPAAAAAPTHSQLPLSIRAYLIRRGPGFSLARVLKGGGPYASVPRGGEDLPSRAAWPGTEPRPACRALEGRVVWRPCAAAQNGENSASRAVRTAAAASEAALLTAHKPLFTEQPGSAWTATRELIQRRRFPECVAAARESMRQIHPGDNVHYAYFSASFLLLLHLHYCHHCYCHYYPSPDSLNAACNSLYAK